MTERLKNCPVCNHALDVDEKTRGDWTTYTCPKHGVFNLSNTLSVILVRNPETLPLVANYLENTQERAEVICTADVGI